MKKLYPILTFLILSAYLLNAQTEIATHKIDPIVISSLNEDLIVDYIVVMKEQADLSLAENFRTKEDKGQYVYEQLLETANRSQARLLRLIERAEVPNRYLWIVNARQIKSGQDLLYKIASLPEVERIDPNPIVRFEGPAKLSPTLRSDPNAIEWGITHIGADIVWGMGYTGQGVVVGGQDTGVDWDHPAIIDQYRGWNGSTANHNYNWFDAIYSASAGNPCGSNSSVPCDDLDHGTHTVGTMVGDDGGSNQIGVAPDAKWIACRNMDNNNGTPTTYIDCFQWFLAPRDLNGDFPEPTKAPHVINNSWGCPTSEGCNSGNWALMETAVNNLRTAGVVVVASAGNGGSGCGSVNTPAAMFSGSFSVGATNSSSNIAGFSSRGPVTVDGSNRLKPNISAPGVSVRSCIRNGNYATWGGTSMAGPHIVGTVALMISAEPTLAGNVTQIESILTSTATGRTTSQNCGAVSGSTIPNNTYGYGIVDAFAAVNAVMALPIDLIDFYTEVEQEKSVINLYWTTASELNSDHFIIEKSNDLQHWFKIGKQNAQFNSSISQSYQHEDFQPFIGKNYYRLKQVDVDGQFEYSKVIVAQFNKELSVFSLFPNPVQNELTLQLSKPLHEPYIIHINGALGKLIYRQALDRDQSQVKIAIESWPSGVYFVRMTNNQGILLGQEMLIRR